MTIRTPFGGGIRGGHYHSQSTEAYFCHTPGLKVVVPSTPKEAKGLLTSSIRDPDPVLFLEPKKLYRSSREEVPEGEVTVPLGQAAVRRSGKDVSLIAYGYMAQVCLDAATKAAEKGVEADVIDLRTLVPLDEPTVLSSVKKTGRAVVVYEAHRRLRRGDQRDPRREGDRISSRADRPRHGIRHAVPIHARRHLPAERGPRARGDRPGHGVLSGPVTYPRADGRRARRSAGTPESRRRSRASGWQGDSAALPRSTAGTRCNRRTPG